MKTTNRLSIRFFTVIVILMVLACSKDDSKNGENSEASGNDELKESSGIIEQELDPYAGQVGLILDVREIAKLGYVPTTAIVTAKAAEGDYSQTITFDPYTFMAQLTIELEGLSDSALKELDAIKVSSQIKDAEGNTIMVDQETTVSFQSNPIAKSIVPINLENLNSEINLSENSSYFIQALDDDNKPTAFAMKHDTRPNWSNIMTKSSDDLNFSGDEVDYVVQFIPIPNEPNTFAIKMKDSGRFIRANTNGYQSAGTGIDDNHRYLHFFLNLGSGTPSLADLQNTTPENYDSFKFKIIKVGTEVYQIESKLLGPIRHAEGVGLSFGEGSWTFGSGVYDQQTKKLIPANPINWRIILANVDWEITSIGTSFQTPILPPAETSFGYNSLLSNCGKGELTGTVGVSQTKSTTMTVGWEESLSITTTDAVNVSTTIGVEFEAKFFKVGAKYNASVTAEYGWERNETDTSTEFGEENKVVETSSFAERTVIVPPGSGSLVYDVFQIYPNTKVEYAQRYRVKARNQITGLSLSGAEIKTNFNFTGFNGVITETGDDFIEITLKGTAYFDQVFKTESTVINQDPECDN